MRRRKCLSQGQTPNPDADESGELLLGSGLGMAALISAADDPPAGAAAGSSSSDSIAGYGKSLCTGKDIQTAECRGEQCQIGKDGECRCACASDKDECQASEWSRAGATK